MYVLYALITKARPLICTDTGQKLNLQEIGNFAVSLVHVLFTRQYYMHFSRQSFSQQLSDFLVETTGKHLGEPSYPGMNHSQHIAGRETNVYVVL